MQIKSNLKQKINTRKQIKKLSKSQFNENKVIDYFLQISKIPRVSGNEKIIALWLEQQFKKLNCSSVTRDESNNVFATFNATKGFEHLPILMLQAHSDMIGVKTDNSKHNFKRDPINVFEENGWLKAKDTSLGADNGIGIATILCLLSDDSINHGPLEILITSQEENGMHGVKAFNYNLIKAKYLINLDSENDRDIIIGCGGGSIIDSTSNVIRENVDMKDKLCFELTISGLLGGHSAMSINDKRLNAIKLMGHFLDSYQKNNFIQLIDIEAGEIANVIPNTCSAKFLIDKNDELFFKDFIENQKIKIKKIYPLEKKLEVKILSTKTSRKPFIKKHSFEAIKFLNEVFDGVKVFNKKYNQIQASSNFGVLKTTENVFIAVFNTRDIVRKSKLETNRWILKALKKIKAEIKIHGGDGWNQELKIPKIAKEFKRFTKLHSKLNIKYSFTTGGLEIKHLVKNAKSLDSAFSYGATIVDPHSTNEKALISSIRTVYGLIAKFLQFI